MASAIDLDTLREMLASAERMVPYYNDQVAAERAENAAMIAAGLQPKHSDFLVKLHADHAEQSRREVAVLRHLISYHSGEVFAGEVAA